MPRPAALLLLLLAGCGVDNALNPKDDGNSGFDTGDDPPGGVDSDSADPPATEECNGVDDDGDGQVDEGFVDADGNGRADCMDQECPALTVGSAGNVTIVEECQGTTGGSSGEVADPWKVRIKWQVTSPAGYPTYTNSYHSPMIGNLNDDNGDGVINEDDTPEVVVNAPTGSAGIILVLDGATGAEEWVWTGAGIGSGIVIADVDADGAPDVVTSDASGLAVALDGRGSLKWRATRMPSYAYYNLITVADIEEDGVPEVIIDDLVLDGPSGATRFSLNANVANPYRMVAVADADRDGQQEMFIAGKAYRSDGTLWWDSGESGGYGFWPVVVQADGDDEAEVGFVGQNWSLYEHDGSRIYQRSYGQAQPGPPCVGDFDGDGTAEVAWPAYQNLVMYELDGSPVWSVPINDTSGLAGCSGYDVNGDGALEILFADQTSFSIFDGSTGANLYSNPNHRSGTLFEYPTVADTDHDGHAEILITSNYWTGSWGVVTAFENDGDGWPAAGSTWAIHDFAITNIESDGSIPVSPDPYWLTYNVYRARVAADDPSSADLTVQITDACVMDCTYGPVTVAVQVANQGAVDVSAGASLSLYAVEGSSNRLVAVAMLPEIPQGMELDGITFDLAPEDVGLYGFRAVIDDDGTGRGIVNECDEDNNFDEYADAWCP